MGITLTCNTEYMSFQVTTGLHRVEAEAFSQRGLVLFGVRSQSGCGAKGDRVSRGRRGEWGSQDIPGFMCSSNPRCGSLPPTFEISTGVRERP